MDRKKGVILNENGLKIGGNDITTVARSAKVSLWWDLKLYSQLLTISVGGNVGLESSNQEV